MRTARYLLICGVSAAAIFAVSGAWSQDGLGERIGETLDRTVGQLREQTGELAEDLRAGFARAKRAVDRMSVEARVYARLHWDKDLGDAELSIDVEDDGAAVIEGVVKSEDAKAKASRLAEDTVGVTRVANRLKVAPATNR